MGTRMPIDLPSFTNFVFLNFKGKALNQELVVQTQINKT